MLMSASSFICLVCLPCSTVVEICVCALLRVNHHNGTIAKFTVCRYSTVPHMLWQIVQFSVCCWTPQHSVMGHKQSVIASSMWPGQKPPSCTVWPFSVCKVFVSSRSLAVGGVMFTCRVTSLLMVVYQRIFNPLTQILHWLVNSELCWASWFKPCDSTANGCKMMAH